jgi:hypothetical protein
MSYITHSQWWADHWAKLGCDVVEITEATKDNGPEGPPHASLSDHSG